ncbi:MAG TPA: VOC family protein [Nocardioidaceae bacterium]|nr:VOC family protein [Nocardioidaceae bacterium]
MRLHHVQVSCPVGGEDAARSFYGEALGIPEVEKPPVLAARGGCWFRDTAVEIHVGVEQEFRPAAKAHPAFLVDDIEALAVRLAEGNFPVTWDDDFPGYRRFYTADGNGNRVEVLAAE